MSTRTGNRFVQFHVSPDDGVFAETVSNAYLGPDEKLDVGQLAALLSLGWAAPTRAPDSPPPVDAPRGSPNHFREFPRPCSCAEVARFAVRTLTEPLRVGSPAELEYKSFDEAGHAVTLPVLPIERLPLPPPKVKAPAKHKGSTEFDRLRAKVLAAARAGTGQGSLAYDDAGALHVPVGNRMGWIRPYERPQYVRVHIHLLSDIEGGEDFLAQVHDVNSRLPVVRVIYTGQEHLPGSGLPRPTLPRRAPDPGRDAARPVRRGRDRANCGCRPSRRTCRTEGARHNSEWREVAPLLRGTMVGLSGPAGVEGHAGARAPAWCTHGPRPSRVRRRHDWLRLVR